MVKCFLCSKFKNYHINGLFDRCTTIKSYHDVTLLAFIFFSKIFIINNLVNKYVTDKKRKK